MKGRSVIMGGGGGGEVSRERKGRQGEEGRGVARTMTCAIFQLSWRGEQEEGDEASR